MEFFRAFGVDWKILVAQFVNFAILMFVLYKLAYRPLLQFMKDRQNAIEKGLEEAKQAKALMAQASSEQERVLDQARKEAVGIVEAARNAADARAAKLLAQAKTDVARVVAEGKLALAAERTNMVQQAKKDIIDMVVASTEKILHGVVDETVDQKWLKSRLAKEK